ncbi:putative NAD-dependent DNA ligase subunit A [Pectobacterium phage DU_PP_V]|uniref:DNA ligase (NAD(+)) n=1 Tax=Pectobacterium phage DU_PP_V TaxID=2041492 RepID=A0A2D2W702_9CAUD|nr:NAD-dependent DNA ligase [Pectobacterium phage DU_PP_V]ATS94075.1 putative NAD-dependent DNA ligase subunit A [Pectobacterium phage DU_PP_V]
MQALKDFIKQCQDAYDRGSPLLTNEEYDALTRRNPRVEEEIGVEGDQPHIFRMYSLQKVYKSRGEDHELIDSPTSVETDKLDGCAISLLYLDGVLVQALTRGNGIKGEDVTLNAKMLNVPRKIDIPGILQITGEVLVTKELDNMRNYSSGAMRLSSTDEFFDRIKEAGLVFAAYGVQGSTESVGLFPTYREDLKWLVTQGFLTVGDINDHFDWFPTDGKVYRLDSNTAFVSKGWTNKFPRGAIALKEDAEGEITTLRKVTWDVGASGKVTPVGHFDPVTIDGATITKATLNNQEYISGLDLELNCMIKVIRAGGVIPRIIERIYD